MLRVGRIWFVNVAPFFHFWRDPSLEFIKAPPRVLGEMARAGTLDLAPLPVVDGFRLEETFEPLGRFGIAATGKVLSVFLFSRRPIETLSGATISLTTDSATSVALLKLLLTERYRVTDARFEPCHQDSCGLWVVGCGNGTEEPPSEPGLSNTRETSARKVANVQVPEPADTTSPPTNRNPQPATSFPRPKAGGAPPTTHNPKPAPHHPLPTSNSPLPTSNQQPATSNFQPLPDAHLVIGDRALELAQRPEGWDHVYDLAELWNGWTGLPFTFARWVIRRDRPAGEKRRLAATLEENLARALDRLPEVAAAEAARTGMDRDLLQTYLGNFTFRLGDPELRGIDLFREKLRAMGWR